MGRSMADLAHDADHAARARVAAMLHWASGELDLLSSALKPASDEDLRAVQQVHGVDQLPGAYEAFLSGAGRGGVGSILHELFPGADVGIDSMLPDDEWMGGRALAEEVLRSRGHAHVVEEAHVIVRVHRGGEVDWVEVSDIGASEPDPPVLRLHAERDGSTVVAPRFTDWLEEHIRRAIKRRYPLRDATFPGGPTPGGDALPQRRRG
jgi:hypothetical protein